jgi:hypothetical protein
VIKAITDKADSQKSDLWRGYASHAAAAFALGFLDEQHTLFIGSRASRARARAEQNLKRLVEAVNPDGDPTEPFRRGMAHNIVKAALAEVTGLLSNGYEVNVSSGEQFLLRAEPLFGKARTLYATSLDTVSAFWADPATRTAATRYLKHQAPEGIARRLFVFSTPDAAHHHARILDQHVQQYRHVYVCSMDHYRRRIAPHVLRDGAASTLQNRDFAVLGYGDSCRVLAELDAHWLRFRSLETDGSDPEIAYPELTSLFEKWASAAEGEFCDDNTSVLRWSKGMWLDRKRWGIDLQSLFSERAATPDAIHMIFFRVEHPNRVDQFKEWLADIKERIMRPQVKGEVSIAQRYGIKDMWIGRKVDKQSLRDARSGGSIQATSRHVEPFALVMRFETETGLTGFYQDEEHSEIRKDLFEKLDSRLKRLYTAAPLNGSPTSESEVAYEAIEAIASQHIHRRDYLEDEAVGQMVQTVDPYDPAPVQHVAHQYEMTSR